MVKAVTGNRGTAEAARRTLLQNGHDVDMGEFRGVFVLVCPTAADSTMASLGLSLQIAST